MNREQVIATLRAHEPELKQAGVVRLSLFGSTVRGDRRQKDLAPLQAAAQTALRKLRENEEQRRGSPQ